ncbi:DUF349 domain-containing protein [Thiocystis violascens]|uniref:DUF349 domain-containing protein n=1 Tax=Thiocystis violascens (strain ATCC 17096 / DSM 198 / 6111) TaxID=765911 RepID=I3Y6U8_THIV6|nr:DUF349 domain-containing protein [Thiocystis violascens]AFL72716.1 protein of unknown function (DUF349) [Thiocystis violascens DSM 198]
MLFARFLKKRQQAAAEAHQAVASKSQDSLAEQARQSENPARRRDAVRQLQNLPLLRQILSDDVDVGVRETASARLRHLLCDSDLQTVSLAERIDELSRIDDLQLIEQIASQASAPEIRRAALDRVQSPAVLAQCAVQDPLALNRGLAIERLHDRQSLALVVRQIGKKDKHVYRTAREKLCMIAEREELPSRIRAQREDICTKAERLGRLGNWSQDRALLEHLDRQWAVLEAETEAEADVRARYQAERERFLKTDADFRRENATQIARHEALDTTRAERQALLDELSGVADLTDESEIGVRRERIAMAWNALSALPDPQQRGLDARYQELIQAVDTARQALADRHRHAERLRRTVAQAQRLLDDTRALDHRKARVVLAQGRALAADLPDNDDARNFLILAERLESRLSHQRRHAEQRLAQLPQRLAELESRLAAGELKKADPLYQSLQAGLELIQASELPTEATAEIANRLRVLAPQLRELQHWRRWGADQHREGLCADMEALVDKELPLEALADQLHTLQMDWKGLDKSGSPANQTLWERFHAASESVYARCRPFMEHQAAERESNRLAREQVCQQIEDFLSKVDWERVDWKKILRAERETRQTWAAIGATEGRHRKALERRFHRSLKQLDQRLDAERKLNQAHKRNLIERVRTLVDAPDLDAAIERTKSLQREWRTTVPARQKDENRLWQSFRAACDAVFERRVALHQAQTNELKDNLAARESLCAEARTFAASETDPQRLAAGLREFDERWRDLQALPIPRQSASQLARRWHDCRDELERRTRVGEEQQRQAALDLLQRQADLCEQFELGVLGETPDALDPADARQQWNQLRSEADSPLNKALSARFEFALAAAVGETGQLAELRRRFADNARQRSRLCLQLEIIAGVDSPPELAQQRLEFQVARLAERMVEGEDDPLQGATQLLRDWYLCGPAPRDDRLNARFERVRHALMPKRTGEEATV